MENNIYKNKIKEKPYLIKTSIFFGISFLLVLFILINSGIDGKTSGSLSGFFSNIFANIINNHSKEATIETVPVTGIELTYNKEATINKRPGYLDNEIPLGGTKLIKANVLPNNASIKGVTFSTNSDKVILSQSGLSCYVEIDEIGVDYEIVAKTVDGNFTSTYKFSCVEPIAPYDFEVPETIELTEKYTTKIDVNNISEGITNSLLAARYYDENKLTYSSEDTSIVEIKNNGVIAAKSVGNTIVKVSNGRISKDINVNVTSNTLPYNEMNSDYTLSLKEPYSFSI